MTQANAAQTCPETFSPKKTVVSDSPPRTSLLKEGAARDDIWHRLDNDLKAIRSTPQEPLLREQGFKPSYYAGVDQAREFKRVQEYLQEIKADPKRTHIPYFANQAAKTIADFEKALKEPYKTMLTNDADLSDRLSENLMHLWTKIKRLQLWRGVKREARRRVENQEVTYDWWANFNLRLSFLADPGNNHTPINSLRTNEGIEYASFYPPLSWLSRFLKMKKHFPNEVMFFSTDDMGIMSFNRVGGRAYLVGVSGKGQTANGQYMNPLDFFRRNVDHTSSTAETVSYNEQIDYKEIEKRLNNISDKSDREKAEFALFLFQHESDGMLDAKKNAGASSYIPDTPLTKKEFEAETRKLFYRRSHEFPNRFREILPDYLQNRPHWELEGSDKLIDEILDIFMHNFSDLLID